MIDFDVTADFRRVERILARSPQAATKATNRTINTVMRTVAKETNKEIRQKYNLKAKDVNKALDVKRSSFRDLSSELKASPRPLSLRAFGARIRIKKVDRRRLPHISVKVLKQRGRTHIKRGFSRKWSQLSGALSQAILVRGKGNSITKANTFGIAKMFVEPQVTKEQDKTADKRWKEVFPKEVQREIDRIR